MEEFSRTEMLIGADALEKLKNARVAVFGVGGVGGYVIEALARAGVGMIDIIDNDTVSKSNINRQIIALHSTVGRKKTEVMAERIKDINPDVKVTVYNLFFLPDTPFDFSCYDYVVDAIDTVSGKLSIIERATAAKTPVISSMGTGNKLGTQAFEVADVTKTSVCPLARVMRRELKKRGVEHVKVVYSKEEPRKAKTAENNGEKPVPASISFVPPMAGLTIAGEVIKDLIK
ncbi:MAG: tRNA threonylcarbamoyladenosine dehydratase [Clostridia bacterium]|nr:tRNA threonylcarbamoyladenosine dehydratase [Clostridia bacterium]